MLGSLNSTFITLIPKNDNPESFSDFRLIYLRNLVYKIVTKVIAKRLKPKLSEVVYKEQFSFLSNREIFGCYRGYSRMLIYCKDKKYQLDSDENRPG